MKDIASLILILPFLCLSAYSEPLPKILAFQKEFDKFESFPINSEDSNSLNLVPSSFTIRFVHYPDETQRVQKFHIGIEIGLHKGFKQ